MNITTLVWPGSFDKVDSGNEAHYGRPCNQPTAKVGYKSKCDWRNKLTKSATEEKMYNINIGWQHAWGGVGGGCRSRKRVLGIGIACHACHLASQWGKLASV